MGSSSLVPSPSRGCGGQKMPILGNSSGLAYIAFAPEEERDALLALLARSSDPHDALPRDPGKLGGQWCVKGTRIPVQVIINNAADAAAEEIATEIFELTLTWCAGSWPTP